MVISIDSVLIKQLGELLNVILAISINTWQDERRFEFYFADNVILTHIATEGARGLPRIGVCPTAPTPTVDRKTFLKTLPFLTVGKNDFLISHLLTTASRWRSRGAEEARGAEERVATSEKWLVQRRRGHGRRDLAGWRSQKVSEGDNVKISQASWVKI